MRALAVTLVHYPVLDRAGETITTAITNLDLHDIARSSRAFGCSDYFVVHPIAAQRDLANRVREHWLKGSGSRRIPDRIPAMERMRVVESLEQVFEQLGGGRSGVEVWVTSAKTSERSLSFAQGRERLAGEGKPVALLFGTGWGLASSLMQDADVYLEPIKASFETGFNHLSVRAACAISLDRLVGAR